MVFVITLQIYTAVILGRCWIIAEKLDPSIVVKNRFVFYKFLWVFYKVIKEAFFCEW